MSRWAFFLEGGSLSRETPERLSPMPHPEQKPENSCHARESGTCETPRCGGVR